MTRWGGWFGGRSVLVIGGLGFIGVNLTQALLDAGARVTVMTPSRGRRRETAAAVEARGAAVLEGTSAMPPRSREPSSGTMSCTPWPVSPAPRAAWRIRLPIST